MVQPGSKRSSSVVIDGVFIAVITTLFRWVFGIAASIAVGIALAQIHFPKPENPMVAAWIAWTLYCAFMLVRALMRIAGSVAR